MHLFKYIYIYIDFISFILLAFFWAPSQGRIKEIQPENLNSIKTHHLFEVKRMCFVLGKSLLAIKQQPQSPGLFVMWHLSGKGYGTDCSFLPQTLLVSQPLKEQAKGGKHIHSWNKTSL